jgi:hypothetical protein
LRTFKSEKRLVANLSDCHFLEGYIATDVPEENRGYCESKGLIVLDEMEIEIRR